MYILRGKRVHLNFHMQWSTVFKIFPMIFFYSLLQISSAVLAKECRRKNRELGVLCLCYGAHQKVTCVEHCKLGICF